MHWVDPDSLPETRGTLARFLLNPKADVDGLLFDDGTEVHTPPHLSAQLLKALRPGAGLGVRGLKPRGADVLVALAVDPDGAERIVDEGPHAAPHKPKPKPPAKPKPAQDAVRHAGIVARLLHGPHGQVHGALLEDGLIVRFPPHAVPESARWLTAGKPLAAQGELLASAHGQVLHAQALGASEATLQPLPPKPKPPKPHHKPLHAHADDAAPKHGPKAKPKPKPKPKSH
ncbi:hypothetical protein J7373_14045 [Xanthomonas sp. A2111]|uniref:Uncharacterized protein n=1 Tax=Xanthomonas hawaiiensis TaxID=3003247 RepID=A0ABU2I6T8_9XANT|nr:hypothetical protein [Xanthomonas sp. A2111]MBO9829370.1 hypothetical protein [Xanthomonas sp. A2111]MDS9993869.1 hypothetical protein [Xanthomonas sp. A2111]